MAKTVGVIDPTDAGSIFECTRNVEGVGELRRKQVRMLLRQSTVSGKVYLIASLSKDDQRYPPREFESVEAARVFLRLTEGES